MSSTGRGSARMPDDAYDSPRWTVHALLQRVSLPGARWLEPSVGRGQVIAAVDEWRAWAGLPPIIWDAVELNPARVAALRAQGRRVREGNFLEIGSTLGTTYDVVIGNPPYLLAREFVETGLRIAPLVVYLLRQGFVGTAERSAWLRGCMPDRYTLPHRPTYVTRARWDARRRRFIETTSDSTESEWMIFHRTPRREGICAVLDQVPEEVRAAERAEAPVVRERLGEDGSWVEITQEEYESIYVPMMAERKRRR